jgi:alpha-amylase/alpha-mannosidase (GH57 family)
MPRKCLSFQIHLPYRLRTYTIFDIHNDRSDYFDTVKTREICEQVAVACYIPANTLMLALINRHNGTCKIRYSLSGLALEQLAAYAPDVLRGIQALTDTGCTEFSGEPYYHALSFMYSPQEFARQVKKHSELIRKYFGQAPQPCPATPRALRTWRGNALQQQAIETLYLLKPQIKTAHIPGLLEDWHKLTASDYFHYMSTDSLQRDAEQTPANPYHSPYDAFIIFMNICEHMRKRLKQAAPGQQLEKALVA